MNTSLCLSRTVNPAATSFRKPESQGANNGQERRKENNHGHRTTFPRYHPSNTTNINSLCQVWIARVYGFAGTAERAGFHEHGTETIHQESPLNVRIRTLRGFRQDTPKIQSGVEGGPGEVAARWASGSSDSPACRFYFGSLKIAATKYWKTSETAPSSVYSGQGSGVVEDKRSYSNFAGYEKKVESYHQVAISGCF